MSGYILRFFVYSFVVPLLFTIWFCHTASGQQPVSSDTNTEWGVRSTTVKTESGTLTVNMPDDAALGDTISGTVVADPTGETIEERQANMDTLEGYVVDTEDISSKVIEVEPEESTTTKPEGKKIVTMEIPATVTGEIIDLILKDPKGGHVTNINLPVAPPSSYTPPSVPGQGDYKLPDIGQAGRPIELTGPFDGDIVNTDVKVGGKNAKILAQSPRKTVAESPRDVIGPTDIELRQGNVTVKDRYRNIALRLSADKLRLMRGERTTLRIQVIGLQGLDEEIPLNLENRSPQVVTLEGGDFQTETVSTVGVGPDGVYIINKTLTGIQPGPFSISARISPERTTMPGEQDIREQGGGSRDAGIPEQDDVVEISDESCACENMQVKLNEKIESESYRENFEVDKNEGGHMVKVTKTRTIMAVPYQYKTKCSGGEPTDDCAGGLKLDVEKPNWDGPEPESEEVHNGKTGGDKVSYFKKTKGGEPDKKNINCTRKCPRNRGWSGWNKGTLYYEAVFGELDNSLKESLKFKLSTINCGTERQKSKTYYIYGCECKKITIILPGAKKEPGGTFFMLGDKGVILNQEPGTRLKIPFQYSIDCTGYSKANCNAQIEVEAKPVSWTVYWVKKDGNTVRTRGQEVNPATVEITQPGPVTCSGECGRRGKTSTETDKELRFGIKVKGQDSVDRHEGQLQVSFKHKYCSDFKVMDKSGSGGEVIGKLKIDVDLKSDEWKELVKDD